MVYAQVKANLETAYLAVSTGLATGQATVEYEIRGRRHRVVPSNELLLSIRKELEWLDRKTNTTGRFRLAALRRPTATDS